MSISLMNVSQAILDHHEKTISYVDYERLMELFEDASAHEVIISSNVERNDHTDVNYDSNIVNQAKSIFCNLIHDILGIDPEVTKGIDIEYVPTFVNSEFINVSHIDCIVRIMFASQSVLNKFKITNPSEYNHFVEYEKEMVAYEKRRKEMLKDRHGKAF